MTKVEVILHVLLRYYLFFIVVFCFLLTLEGDNGGVKYESIHLFMEQCQLRQSCSLFTDALPILW